MTSATIIRPKRHTDRSGAAALEFAIATPVLLLLVLATIELVNAVRIQTKLNVAAGQLVEMIAGSSSVTEASARGPGGTLGDMCTAISYNLLPYPNTNLSGWIESTTVIQPFGIQTAQDWINDQSCPSNANSIGSFYESIALTNFADSPRSLFTLDGTPRAQGGTLVRGYSAISLQLTYVYKNVLPFLLGPNITFTAVAAAKPRSNQTIPCTYPSGNGNGTAPCPAVY